MIYLLDSNAIGDLMRADSRIENWMAGLEADDRVVTCTIVRGEMLFGIARLPAGRRRTELEETGHQFLTGFTCESIPERDHAGRADSDQGSGSVSISWEQCSERLAPSAGILLLEAHS